MDSTAHEAQFALLEDVKHSFYHKTFQGVAEKMASKVPEYKNKQLGKSGLSSMS